MLLLAASAAGSVSPAARLGARARAAAPAMRRLVRRAAATETSVSEGTSGPTDVKTILECKKDMSDIVSLCKRRGFVYPSSEIYSGFAGFFDYGPLGVELRNNIKRAWWEDMVQRRDDVVGLDSSIIASPRIWEASGHVAGFSDPMVDCKESKQRFRADQLFFAKVADGAGAHAGYVSLLEGADMEAAAAKAAGALLKKLKRDGPAQLSPLRDFTEADPSEYALVPSPATGEPGTLTAPRDFNLMFQTSVGAMTDGSSVAYLRPETAQGIFTNFKNVVSSTRVKVPFGIAQIGKAFRNEITPRNFIFRSREFEQMELEYFIKPTDVEEEWRAQHAAWVETRLAWHIGIGIDPALLSIEQHKPDKLAHYARACSDIMFKFPFGVSELEGCAHRGGYDLTQHASASGKSAEYTDEETKAKYVPHVIEPSVGVDRCFLAVLCSAYAEDVVNGEARTLLRFHPRVAPIKVGVFPLVKNNEQIMESARELHKRLQRRHNVAFDAAGNIGRRYRRMDEAGTPFCVTVDFQTLEDGTVTLRDRDSTAQRRVSPDELVAFVADACE
ncbi:hypothetical protein KFE25_011588 [Diacronema lutheri]|uniref:glycine--tRNA ligase n=2 Tax=Diacronema lutheri TaxID=2081491 RepID=A0A8J5X942_DIALT|nr:hypothetical protein KFE25_011588 [Diacronema lutheri]